MAGLRNELFGLRDAQTSGTPKSNDSSSPETVKEPKKSPSTKESRSVERNEPPVQPPVQSETLAESSKVPHPRLVTLHLELRAQKSI